MADEAGESEEGPTALVAGADVPMADVAATPDVLAADTADDAMVTAADEGDEVPTAKLTAAELGPGADVPVLVAVPVLLGGVGVLVPVDALLPPVSEEDDATGPPLEEDA